MTPSLPTPPATLFDPVPWRNHTKALKELLGADRDPALRRNVLAALEVADRMIKIIEADLEADRVGAAGTGR